MDRRIAAHSVSALDVFLDRAEAHYQEAVVSDLPIFLTSIESSTPLNATPYLARYRLFRETAKTWPGRIQLISELDRLIERVQLKNLSIDAILLGGSFTELDKPEIGDLDCLLFYRLDSSSEPSALADLSKIQIDAKRRGIDVRFVPLDGDPLILLKMTSYFTILYSKRKHKMELARCLLLLDCRDKRRA